MSSRALILHSHEDLEGKPIALLLPALLLLSGMLLLVVGVVLLLLGGMDQPQLDIPGQEEIGAGQEAALEVLLQPGVVTVDGAGTHAGQRPAWEERQKAKVTDRVHQSRQILRCGGGIFIGRTGVYTALLLHRLLNLNHKFVFRIGARSVLVQLVPHFVQPKRNSSFDSHIT